MLLDNDFYSDPRVKREAISLSKNGYAITVIATKSKRLNQISKFEDILIDPMINESKINKIYNINYIKNLAIEIIKKYPHKLIHCHDHHMLNLGVVIKKINKTLIIYDSHELFSEFPYNFTKNADWIIKIKSFLVRKLEILREFNNKKYIDYLITVNLSILKHLSKYFGINPEKCIEIKNVRNYTPKTKPYKEWLDRLKIPKGYLKIIFIGNNLYPKTMNLKNIIDQFSTIPKIALILISKDSEYKEEIELYCHSNDYNHVFFKDLIEPELVISYLSGCDIGLLPIYYKKYLSYYYSLSNKLFDYLQAELPILATKQPEFIKIIEKEKIGICINPNKKNIYKEAIEKIIKNYTFYKQNLLTTKKTYCWENEQEKIINFYDKIIYNHFK